MSIKRLYKQQLENFQMDVASVVIVHLVMGKLSEKKRTLFVQANLMGAESYELAEELSLETGCYVSMEDIEASNRYWDDKDFRDLVDSLTPEPFRDEDYAGCGSWADVMRALFPKNPASKPVPRPEPEQKPRMPYYAGVGIDPASEDGPVTHFTLGEGGMFVQNVSFPDAKFTPEVMDILYGEGWDQMGSAPETYYPDQVDDPSWSPGLTEPDEDTIVSQTGAVYMAPVGTDPSDDEAWTKVGYTSEDGLTLKPEESDCGAPIVHEPRKSGCQQCPCVIVNCQACYMGKHAEGAE